MKRKVIVAMVILLASSLALGGCAAKVSQELYDSVVAERNAAQAEIANVVAERDAAQTRIVDLVAERDAAQAEVASLVAERDAAQPEIANLVAEIANLEAEIENLQSQIETLSTTTLVEEAWDEAQQRYATLRENIGFDLEELASWLELPAKPTWLDSARLSSILLVDEPSVYEAVTLITLTRQQMFAKLSVSYDVTSMTWRGDNRDYEMTLTKRENGDIHRVTMKAGESQYYLTWTAEDGGVSVLAEANESWRVFSWSNDPAELVGIYSDMISWLEEIDEAGGLIAPSDQPLAFLALGELSKPPYAEFVVDWAGAARRIVIAIFLGVPASCIS